MELFLHPWYMVAGGALVSLPIIIHLINRMRFKRIRWAAMEFLLKSQKRNRRKLIIEQLILLALRCLLVLLAGFLVSRFVGDAFGAQGQSTFHVVVLDDTLSMTDRWKDKGSAKTSYALARDMIKQIASRATQASSAQHMKVVPLSDTGKVLFDQRLNDASVAELVAALEQHECTARHLSPLDGLKWARDELGQNPQSRRVFHLVSDFRARDWSGSEGENLLKELDSLAQNGNQVSLIDVAFPYRGESRLAVRANDNVGIIDLRPDSRVTAKRMLVRFVATIENFTDAERKDVFITVKVNGVESGFGTQNLPSLPPGRTKHVFDLGFNDTGFNRVSATLSWPAAGDKKEETGIDLDNARYAVVDVQERIPVLIVDGAGQDGQKPGGDTYFVDTVFTVARGFDIVARGVEELEKPLDRYPTVVLLNVPEVKNDKALKNLEDYVRRGGSVLFFLGDKVDARRYNERLYNDGKGIFPVPLAASASLRLPEEKRTERMFDEQFKLFLRDEAHPALSEIAKNKDAFKYLTIDQYFPTQRRSQWNAEPGQIQELITLPNEASLDEFKTDAQELIRKLPVDEAKFSKFRPALEMHQRLVRNSLTGQYLYELANAVEAMLTDPGVKEDMQRPSMVEFWQHPDVQALRNQMDRLRQRVQYGDPLMVAGRAGKGRVVAFLTTAGRDWNTWAGGSPASWTFPMVVLETQKFLTSLDDDAGLTVGSELPLSLDATRYEARVKPYTMKEEGAPTPGRDEQLPTVNNRLEYTVRGDAKPGYQRFDLFLRPETGGALLTDPRAYVFNVDTLAEGDLRRTTRENVEKNPANASPERGKVTLRHPDSDFREFEMRQSDWSESPWLFLIILLVLIVEQALAVHLSFHVKGGEAQLPAAVTGGAPKSAAA